MNDLSEYYPLIRSIAKKFYNVEQEDLYQAGYLGLVKAYNKYTDTSVKFSTYAYKFIFGEMYDLSIKSRNIKLNKDCLKILKLIHATIRELTQEYKREVTLDDISSYLDIDINEIQYIMSVTDETVCLDEVSEFISSEEHSTCIEDAIEELDSLSSDVMRCRLMYDMTQSEVAKHLGLSQVKVSRIETKSKQKLKEYIQE